MTYLATSINESPVITDKAGAVLEDVRGRAVKFDTDGYIVLCAAGENAIGVGIMTNDKGIPAGDDVHIQIKDIGLVRAGAAIAKGAELTPDAEGKFVPAEGGFVRAIALEAASAADVYIKARLVCYKQAGAAEESGNTVDSAEFETLAAAVEAAEDGATIKITADTTVEEPLRIPEGKNITLNIPEGVTLKLNAGADNYGLVAKGSVTVEGEGDIVLTGYGFGTSMNTDSKLTIKSGHFIAQGCDYIIGCFDGEVVIEGGEFSGEYCVVNNFSETYSTDGKVTITGGTFTTTDPEGADVLGNYVEISGGKFSKPVDASYCAQGFTPTTEPDENGYYTVA